MKTIKLLICALLVISLSGCSIIEWLKYGDNGNPENSSLRCPVCNSPLVTITDPYCKNYKGEPCAPDLGVLQGGHPWRYECHKCGKVWEK